MSTDIKPASALKKNNTSKAKESIIVRLSRGRSLKISFRPRIRVAKLLVKLLAIATGLFTSVIGSNAYADIATNALPTGGQVVYGNSTIQQTGNALNINQASQKTIINWQTFDIGAQASVNFYQPNASAIALNRVLGDNASQIFGKLNANGQVFLLNPHGTLFAPNAQVNVGGLLNSTMHMSDENFINSNYSLTNAGNGILDNQGTIYAQSIVFAGNDINNSGSLIATNVSLVAGDTVAVDLSGDGLIRARVQNPAVQAHITNSGLINAVQQVTMSAGQVKDTLNSLVNNTGIVRATGLVNEGGIISLQAGKTLNSGSLDASSATGLGGKVAMLGEHVGVTGTGSIDVSGKTGGGTILVGGDFQGKNAEIQNASRTFFGKDASLNANATETGDGGKIIVWADDVTRGYGNISARGGDISGNGGFVEVSGKRSLDYQATTDTRAPNGKIGTLLLDPDNITISSISVNVIDLADVDQFADPTGDATIAPTTLNNAGTNIILQANQDISFDEAVSINGAGVGITAQAGNSVIVNSSISTNGGIVSLVAGDPLGSAPDGREGAVYVNANIDTTRGGVAPNGANVLLESNIADTGGNSIQLSANVNAGSLGDIIITDNGGSITQTGGFLTGDKLTIEATHTVQVDAPNQLNRVEITSFNSVPTADSNVNFLNTRNLVIDGISVNAGGGTGGNIVVTNNGAITQTGDISTHNGNITVQTINTGQDITIDANISTGSGSSSNSVLLASIGNILSPSNRSIDTSAGNGNITLQATGDIGSPSQAVTVSPGTGNVSLTAGGNIAVHQINSALNISKYTVSASANEANVQLSSVGNLNINANLAFSSAFNTQDDNLSFTSVNGNVNISDNISIEANSVLLSSSSGNVNIGSGTGTVNLTIAQDNGVNIAAGNAININNGLTRNQNGNDRIFLFPGNVAGAGSISTSKLVIQSSGAVNLTGVHQVSQLAAEVINAGAGFNFLNNSASLEIFSDGSIHGITTNNGAASITNQGGSISVNAGIDLGNANLVLGSAVDININNSIEAGNVTIAAINDVNIDGDITQTSSTSSMLAISAGNNITIQGGSDFTSPHADMRVLITSDSDSSDGGRILLNNDSSDGGVDILSNGGDINLAGGNGVTGFANSGVGSGILLDHSNLDARGTGAGGKIKLNGITEASNSVSGVEIINSTVITNGTGTIDITGFAIAADTNTHGVDISSDSRIESFDGKITIEGDASDSLSSSNSNGVYIRSGSLVLTDGAGDIEVTGTSAFEGTNQSGIAIEGLTNPPIFQTEIDAHGTGNIILTGTSNGIGVDSNGIKMSVGAIVETDGTGNITMIGEANNFDAPGLNLDSSALIKTFKGGDITIRAGNDNINSTNSGGDHIDFVGGSIQGSTFTDTITSITKSTVMVLTPLTTQGGTGIEVGGNGIIIGTVGKFNVSDADLAAITNVASFQIGDTFHTGSFNVATLNTFSGTNQQLNLVSNASLIDFTAPSTSLASNLLVNAANGSIELNSLAVTGKLTALARNNITLKSSASVTATDKILLAAQTGNFINNSGNALFAPNHWTVVSQDPSLDTRGGLVYNYKQYNTTYDPSDSSFSQTIQGSGDGFVYALAPRLTTTLTGNPDDVSKVYDATTDASLGQLTISNFNASGLVDTDELDTYSATTLTYIDKNVGTGKTVQATSVSLAITDSNGANVYGYENQNVSSVSGAIGEITAASLTVTGQTADNRVYDSTRNANLSGGTLSGIIGSDIVNLTNGSGLFDDKHVGIAKAVTVNGSSLSGTDAGNYIVIDPTGLTADITPKALTVAGQTAANKVYDATTSASISGGTLVGAEIDDFVFLANGTGTFTDKNVGSAKVVNVTGTSLTGSDATNYTIADPTGITADITPASISTVTGINANNKVYDATTSATTNASAANFSGKLGSDVLTVASSSAAFTDKNVGSAKTVNISGITLGGADAGNYTLANNTATSTADITPASISTVNAISAVNKVYDTTTSATLNSSSATFTGKLGSDVLTVASASGAFADKNAGSAKTINISGITLGGADAGNYTLANNTASTTADITPASISTVTGINANNKVYDATTSATTNASAANFSGKLGSDVLTVASSSAAFTDKNVGSAKTVNISGITLGGADAGNYTLANNTATSTADITPASISAVNAISAVNKVYDTTTSATLNSSSATFTGKLGSDVLTVASASGAFADKNAGSAKTVNISGITLGGADAGNYTLANNSASTTADITPASISTVTGINANNKIYDATTSATTNASAANFSGKLGSDVLTVASSSAAFTDKNVGSAKTVNISGITLGGADAGNYTLANNTATSTADITPAPLIVSAQGINKLFDGTTAAQVALSDNRIAGDNLTITNSSANFADAEVGTNKQIDVLGIAIDGGIDAGNYELQNTDTIAFADIFKEDGTKEANLTETNVIDSTQNLQLAVTAVQVKTFNENGTENVVTVDVPKGKVLSCK